MKKKESIEIPLPLARLLAAEKEDIKANDGVTYEDVQLTCRSVLRLLIASEK